MFGDKIFLHILKKTETGYAEIKLKKLPFKADEYYWNKKQYFWTLAELAYYKPNKHQFHIYKDYDSGDTVLKWGEQGAALPADGIKQRNKERLIEKAVNAGGMDFGMVTIIAVAIGALCAGLVIMSIAYPSIFPQMMKETAQTVSQVVR